MLRGLLSRLTRGGAGGRTRPGAGAGAGGVGTGGAGRGGSGTDAAIGRGVKKLFRRAR